MITLEDVDLAKIASQHQIKANTEMKLAEKLARLRKPSACGFIDEDLMFSLPKERIQIFEIHQSKVREAFKQQKNENLKKVNKIFSDQQIASSELSEQMTLYVQIIKYWWYSPIH